MSEQRPVGRRERKKALTRTTISDTALRLFLDRGYDQVSIKEIADAADVAVTTVFKHFPGKEALVFDQDADIEAALVAAVRDRPPGTSILEALRAHLAFQHLDDPELRAFVDLVDSTPALRRYEHRMWMRHEAALAGVIAEATGDDPGDTKVLALAHFALEARSLARDRDDPQRVLDETLDLLVSGWGDYGRT